MDLAFLLGFWGIWGSIWQVFGRFYGVGIDFFERV